MKKAVVFFIASFTAAAVFAGGIENKTNMSTGYLRNPSRNTESSRPDAAFYNIAGTGFLQDGLYIEAGNQFIFKKYMNEMNCNTPAVNAVIADGTEYADNTTVVLYPDVDIVFKKSNFSVFANFGIYAGGGKLRYNNGTAATALAFLGKASEYKANAKSLAETAQALGAQAAATLALGTAEGTANAQALGALAAEARDGAQLAASVASAMLSAANNHSLEINAITYGEQIGLAYNFRDFISVSAAVRFLEGTQDLKLLSSDFETVLGAGNDEVSCVSTAFGVSPVFGVHVKPFEGFDVSAQVQVRTTMEYEVDDVKGTKVASQIGTGIYDGKTYNSDIPTVLNIGTGYQIDDATYVSASFNYYFNKNAKCNSILGTNDYDDSFEIAAGVDYRVCDALSVSCGAAYGKQGVTNDSNNIFNPILDSFQAAFGTEISFTPFATLTSGVTYVKYFESDYFVSKTYQTELNKNLVMMSVGLTIKPF